MVVTHWDVTVCGSLKLIFFFHFFFFNSFELNMTITDMDNEAAKRDGENKPDAGEKGQGDRSIGRGRERERAGEREGERERGRKRYPRTG